MRDSVPSMTTNAALDRFKHRFPPSMFFNSRKDLPVCRRLIDALPSKYRNPARRYILSLLKAQLYRMQDEFEFFMQNMNENQERKFCGMSYKRLQEEALAEPWVQHRTTQTLRREKRARDRYVKEITRHWGEEILYTLRTKGFQEEPSARLLGKASAVATKFPNYNQARRLVNSVIIRRLAENEVRLIGWVQEAKAIDWENVIIMATIADVPTVDHDTLCRFNVHFDRSNVLIPGRPGEELATNDTSGSNGQGTKGGATQETEVVSAPSKTVVQITEGTIAQEMEMTVGEGADRAFGKETEAMSTEEKAKGVVDQAEGTVTTVIQCREGMTAQEIEGTATSETDKTARQEPGIEGSEKIRKKHGSPKGRKSKKRRGECDYMMK